MKQRLYYLTILISSAMFISIWMNSCQKGCCTIGFVINADSVYSIKHDSVLVHVSIVSDDEDSIIVRGVCWSTRQSPTVECDTTQNGVGKGSFISIVKNLAGSTLYYLRPYVTNKKGTAYGKEIQFKTLKAPIFTLGERYGGGVIFWVDSAGVRGLVSALTDAPTQNQWGCLGISIPGAEEDKLKGGLANTVSIVLSCYIPSTAAWICRQEKTIYDTGDWYLPSKYELKLLYLQRNLVGGFENSVYWSSTQSDKDNGWGVNFANGDTVLVKKDVILKFRPVREL